MLIGQLVVALGLASQEEVTRAAAEQRRTGRRLREILTGLSKSNAEELDRVLGTLPETPLTIEELKINRNIARETFLKAAAMAIVHNVSSVANELRLSGRVASDIVNEARQQKLIELRPGGMHGDFNFILSAEGKAQAEAAFSLNSYVGPLPVSLEDYEKRVRMQSVRAETVTPDRVRQVFADLILPEGLIREIGAAANSSKSALLYGPAGNGKTSMAERIGKMFRSFAFVPYAFEVAGQIIQVFDDSVHFPIHEMDTDRSVEFSGVTTIVAEDYDRRWVPCHRPFVFAGGELTQEMLDLSFNSLSKYYEAPLQVKANNGVLLIDDFGRQIVPPRALLNRWITPMDRQLDYLKLHTGKSFSLPFDALLLFSTNLGPEDIMDPTFLRRIPHKISVNPPGEEDFHAIFHAVAKKAGLELFPGMVEYVIERIRGAGVPLAGFQPGFIVGQIIDLRRFMGSTPVDERTALDFGLKNLLAA
jgi:hypothetical protein